MRQGEELTREEEQEIGQLLSIAEEYLELLRKILELTSGSSSDKWRIDDWRMRKKELLK